MSDCNCNETLSTDCSTTTPTNLFYSTQLNNYISSYNALGDKIARALGAPIIRVELHQDQVYENIAEAINLFSKYAGQTREALVFDSKLYDPGRGVRLDTLFTLSRTLSYWSRNNNSAAGNLYETANMVLGDPYNAFKLQQPGPNAINTNMCGCENLTISKDTDGKYYRSCNPNDYELLNSYDYLINDYRKVSAVTYFEEGTNTGINTLFTIEQSLAQQAYYSYALGNFGFDLISWQALKNWLKDRNKMLALNRSVDFDKRTQYMRLWSAPKDYNYAFFGIVGCFVERKLSDLLKEEWVYRYALALSKITLGYIRGKFSGATLAGNVSISADIGAQGLQEKDKLEEALYNNVNPGYGDTAANAFFMG